MTTHWTIRQTVRRLAQVARIGESTGLGQDFSAVVDYALSYTIAHQEAETMTYTIDGEKLAEVTRIVNEETDPRATEELIRDNVCYDWREGQEHQDWINKASAQEIADWLATFYGDTA